MNIERADHGRYLQITDVGNVNFRGAGLSVPGLGITS